MNTSKLRLVRGGALAAEQVFGRESELAALTRMLETDSVLLLAERRTGKTSLLTLFEANAPDGWHVVKMSVESIASPEEFARRLRDETAHLIPTDALGRINAVIDRLRISQIGNVVLDRDQKLSTWQESIEVWRSELSKVNGQVVLILDELPYAIQNIAIRVGPEHARHVLDVLRETRQNFPIRFVLCGSIGLHHVIGDIRNSSWSPINDVSPLTLGPLSQVNASTLATALLNNEGIEAASAASSPETIGSLIARETNGVPFYIHEVVGQLLRRDHRPVSEVDVLNTVRRLLNDSQDPLDLRHFEERLGDYYGDKALVAASILDTIAMEKVISFRDLRGKVNSTIEVDEANLRRLLDDLQRDHYLERADAKFSFRLEIIRRAWKSMRYLDE
jgi:uncharacterized protein